MEQTNGNEVNSAPKVDRARVVDATEADPNRDVSKEKIASVYAEAFFAAAGQNGGAEPRVNELEEFVSDVLDTFPKYESVLASGLVSPEEKCELLDRAFGRTEDNSPEGVQSGLTPLTLNFLKVLAKHGRLDCLRVIVRSLRTLHEKSLGRVRVTVTTPAPITDDLAQRLLVGIAPLAGGDPILETRVDPELIGGVVVRVGDTVYDASILTQLKNLREQLIQRSTHEIQSRRDRFRNPE